MVAAADHAGLAQQLAEHARRGDVLRQAVPLRVRVQVHHPGLVDLDDPVRQHELAQQGGAQADAQWLGLEQAAAVRLVVRRHPEVISQGKLVVRGRHGGGVSFRLDEQSAQRGQELPTVVQYGVTTRRIAVDFVCTGDIRYSLVLHPCGESAPERGVFVGSRDAGLCGRDDAVTPCQDPVDGAIFRRHLLRSCRSRNITR